MRTEDLGANVSAPSKSNSPCRAHGPLAPEPSSVCWAAVQTYHKPGGLNSRKALPQFWNLLRAEGVPSAGPSGHFLDSHTCGLLCPAPSLEQRVWPGSPACESCAPS